MKDCSKCRDFGWCSGEELDSEACPVRSGPGLSVVLTGFKFKGRLYQWNESAGLYITDPAASDFDYTDLVPVGAYDLEFT